MSNNNIDDDDDLVDELFNQIMEGKGAPTKFKIEYIKDLLQHVGIEGKSYKSLAFKLGIKSPMTLYNWEKDYPEWKEAKEVANCGRLSYIEDLLTDLAKGRYDKGNAAAAIFYAKNACPEEFKDKRELEVQGGVTYVIDTGIPSMALPDNTPDNDIEDVVYKEIESIEEDSEDLGDDLL